MLDTTFSKFHRDINQSRLRHSCESRNPEETWIPGQARNDRLHKTYPVMHKKDVSTLSRALTAAAGMCLFALFVHYRLPFRVLSICGLCLTLFTLFNDLRTTPFPTALLGLNKLSKSVVILTTCGIIFGLSLGIGYRWGYGLEPWISTIGSFAPVAALIGSTEEILYRGYIQGQVQRFGPFKAVAFSALCHTTYKCLLFAFYSHSVEVNMFFLAACTFGVGLVLGALRERAGSVLPPVAAHAVFDIMAYGDYAQAPWWVWS